MRNMTKVVLDQPCFAVDSGHLCIGLWGAQYVPMYVFTAKNPCFHVSGKPLSSGKNSDMQEVQTGMTSVRRVVHEQQLVYYARTTWRPTP